MSVPTRMFRTLLRLFVLLVACGAVVTPVPHLEAQPDTADVSADTSEQKALEQRTSEYPGPLSSAEVSSIRKDLDAIIEEAALPETSVGMYVTDLRADDVLYDHRGDQQMVPASNTKLVTSAAALDVLGPSYTFETELYAVPDKGDDANASSASGNRPLARSDGIFEGDLFIRGEGEPFLLFEDLMGWAAEMRLRGLEKIQGDLVVDDSAFAGKYLPPGFDTKDEDDAYRAPIGPFSVSFNSVTLAIRPADDVGDPPNIRVSPPNNYVEVVNRGKTFSGRSGYFEITSDPMTAADKNARMAGGPRTRIVVDGSIGLHATPWVSSVRIDHPPAFSASVLREALNLVGIEVTGEIRLGLVSDKLDPVIVHDSRPLTSLVSAMNKWSNNFMAEQILRVLGTTREGPATWAQSQTVVEAFMSRAGVPPDRFTLANGSGLYRVNRIAPSSLVTLLAYMWDHPTAIEYIGSLAVAGRDGTLEDRMTDTAATGNLRAKTGTLEHVSALSGYVETQSGRPLAFSIIFDNTPRQGWRYRDLQDALATRLAEISR